ncbi:MAG: DUF4271 domain-containing protein [Prevotellaceae bacterium]|jgi:hypothetical protein|nr:DUF4271 domain-containing protein [Prevotellaceae bacterium]
MSVTSVYISTIKPCSNDFACNDVQLYVNSDIDISSSLKIFGSKSELLQANTIKEIPNAGILLNRELTSWIISGLLIFYFLMLVLSKKYVPTLKIMLFSNKNKYITYHNFTHDFARTANVFVAFSMLVIAAFFYLLEKHISVPHQTPIELSTTIAIAIFCYVAMKRIIIKIIGYVSENNELKSKLYAIETIISSMYGIFSGFFLIVYFLNPNSNITICLTIISAIFILLYLLKISKVILIFIDEKVLPLFLILYLCAIEILPIWLIIDLL